GAPLDVEPERDGGRRAEPGEDGAAEMVDQTEARAAPDGARDEDPAPPVDAAARKRAAVETFVRHEAVLRRTARRYSLCADDADEALQRGLEILLNKAPSEDSRDLVRWTQTVVKHEALAVRAERERTLAGPAATPDEPGREDWVSMLPAEVAGPAERAERHEAIERSREALATLKPQELRALGLLAEGYSYREIAERTSYSPTKVNRVIAEGRERFRRFLLRREGGARCAELAPLLSAFADDEAAPADVATLREHLRTCAHCRATLRAYRAAPGAAAALLPILPPVRGTVVGRLHDAYAALATRVGGGSSGASDSTLGGLAAAGGTRGAGMAAIAKVLAICAGTVGGAAACVATGVVPAPLLDPPDRHATPPAKAAHHHRHQAEDAVTAPVVEYETATPTEGEVEPEPEPREASRADREAKAKEEPHQAEEAAAAPPPSESGAVEYTEPPPTASPVETAASSSSSSSSGGASGSSSSGNAAGEFGP
ncbi:MAG TPA: sigma-70 family RNA polymerase sigma factor, partial [Solirubrobacterales bacterium]|nr:sigma-70 family RNA polymerase sigma factor [Solirubrobacterales bacterium]